MKNGKNLTLHPWYEPEDTTELDDARLQEGEHIRMIGLFTADTPIPNKTGHILFHVVETGEKAQLRITMSHGERGDKFCQGHCTVVAEYPLKDVETLIAEAKEFAEYSFERTCMLGEMGGPLKVDKKQPLALAICPQGTPNEAMMGALTDKMLGETQKNPVIREQCVVIAGLLGFGGDPEKREDEEPEENAHVKIPARKHAASKEDNRSELQKAADEVALVNMYGKDNIEKLAKKIGYKGVTVNTKQDVKNSK